MASAYDLTVMFMIYVGWWLIPLVILFFYRKHLMKYPIQVIIYEKRGKALICTNDRAGRFDDPVHEYRLKMTKDSIPVPEYDWVLQCAYKPTTLFEKMQNILVGFIGTITLFKYGSKQYKIVQVKMKDGTIKKVFKTIKDKYGKDIIISVYEPLNVKANMGNVDFRVIDWDDINHMSQELRATATRRSPIGSFLEKHGAIIGVIFAIMGLIIAGYYYKEMIIDAGSKAAGIINAKNNEVSKPVPTESVNNPLNIPLIGDLAA